LSARRGRRAKPGAGLPRARRDSAKASPDGSAGAARGAWIGAALLALAVALWAGNWVIGRMIRLDAPPGGITFVRWTIAACVLLAFNATAVRAHWATLRRSWVILLLLAVSASVLQHLPVYIGLRTTTATTASLLNATTPVFILLLGWLVLGERLSAAVLAGVAVALAGAVWIVTRGEPGALVHWALEAGDLWILLGTLSWAAYTVMLRWRPPGLPPLTFLCAIAALGALVSLPVAAIEFAAGERFIWSWPLAACLLYIGIGATVVGYICWNRGVEVLGASRAGPFMYLMPVYTPLMGWLFLGEQVQAFHLAGISLIFAGILLTRRDARPTP
jgi:drug/metabolite transporter (DMT)-like permease